jgi:hypothetical protein
VLINGETIKDALNILYTPSVEVGQESCVGPVQIDRKLYLIKISVEEYTPSWMTEEKEGSQDAP